MVDAEQGCLSNITDEIRELQRTSLFTDEETKDILKKRQSFQCKINGYCRSLQDIKDYIENERSFLRQISVRREKYGYYSHRRTIEHSIEHKVIGRVKSLYELGMNLVPDYNFSLSYFKFCKLYGFHDVAKKLISDMTDKFSSKLEIWETASSYFLKTNRQEAQFIINRGLHSHKDSKALYLDAIDLELQIELEHNTRDSSMNFNERVKKYTELIFRNIKDFNFLVDILKLLQPHKFTKDVQDAIIGELLNKYFEEELVWHHLAEREKDGYHYTLDEEPNKAKKIEEALKESKTKDRLLRCVDRYKKGFRKVPPERRTKLWLLYLDTLINIQKQNPDISNNFRSNLLETELEAASQEIKLEEKHYAAWIECAKDEESFAQILKKATSALPQSCLMWQLRLKYFMKKGQKKEIEVVFEEARENLQENAEPIWSMYISHHSLHSDDDRIKSIYLRGIKEPEIISSILKPAYIEWTALALGIREAREAYNEIVLQRPYCKELHLMMLKLESFELVGYSQDLKEWGKCLQLAYDQFSKEDVDVYINYITFYKRHHRTTDSERRIRQKYEEARKNLPENLFLEFKEKYSYL